MKDLQEELRRLFSSRGDDGEVDGVFSEKECLQEPEPSGTEGWKEPVPMESENGNSHHGEGWKPGGSHLVLHFVT